MMGGYVLSTNKKVFRRYRCNTRHPMNRRGHRLRQVNGPAAIETKFFMEGVVAKEADVDWISCARRDISEPFLESRLT